ncbi:hypothetical protein KUTeg_017415 [Tegillarca granosa]|uniref:Uncharacterized protein n=1 Tax=Tegillarca granosa TaxID=220873 RepID=A0ABQ9ENB1_TEGGR|nr:hypothetical protein KUTeg_017415 [Tegillarca granosa]
MIKLLGMKTIKHPCVVSGLMSTLLNNECRTDPICIHPVIAQNFHGHAGVYRYFIFPVLSAISLQKNETIINTYFLKEIEGNSRSGVLLDSVELKEKDQSTVQKIHLDNEDVYFENLEITVTEEQPVDGSKFSKTGHFKSACPICPMRTRKMKRDAFLHHVLETLQELTSAEVSDPGNQQSRLSLLHTLADFILGPGATITDLFDWVRQNITIHGSSEIPPKMIPELKALCRTAGWDVPEFFTLHPMNSQVCTVFWRVYLFCCSSLTLEQQAALKQLFLSLKPSASVTFTPSESQDKDDLNFEVVGEEVIEIVVDDSVLSEAGKETPETSLAPAPAPVAAMPSTHSTEPSNYPTSWLEDPKWKYPLVAHPKSLEDLIPEKFAELQRLLAVPYKLLILHLRGPAGDECGLDVSVTAFHLVKEICHPQQRIHLHCFSGDPKIKRMWSDHFQHVYFGFTAMVERFNSRQIQALREIDSSRLLLETDSPYFPPRGKVRVNTPAYIGKVAVLVSSKGGDLVSTILWNSVDNGRRLYQ